jgi:subtilisin family serine protease
VRIARGSDERLWLPRRSNCVAWLLRRTRRPFASRAVNVSFFLDDGSTPLRVTVIDQGSVRKIDPDADSYELDLRRPRYVIFAPPDGYWDVIVDTRELDGSALTIIFNSINSDGPIGWWHRCHGMESGPAADQQKIRIGIVDEALETQGALSCIRHVTNLGGAPWHASNNRPFDPKTDHGQAVTSLLASRVAAAAGFVGAGAEAQIFFAAAGEEDNARLSVSRIIASINHLVDQMGCDLVSVSAGDHTSPILPLKLEVDDAAERGALCFFAAGNHRVARYPALYDSCLAVAALGHSNSAPPGTLVDLHNRQYATPLTNGFYLWNIGAYGPEVEFCAPGVGVIWNRDGCAARGAVGTSYACPIGTGIAAAILAKDPQFLQMPRTRQRYDHALNILRAHCLPLGVADEGNLWKYGRLWIKTVK